VVITLFVLAVAAVIAIVLTSDHQQSAEATIWRVDAPTKGKTSAKVKMVEFGDFACVACADFRAIKNALLEQYPNDLQYQFRFFPTANHPNSYSAAVTAEIANQHDQFWVMSDLLYENHANWQDSTNFRSIFANFAVLVGIDQSTFTSDFDKLKTADDVVDKDVADGNALSITETPAIFLNDTRYGGTLTQTDLAKAIDSLLK
jgi:protein-disulfide isomerase